MSAMTGGNKRYPRTILAAVCIPWDADYQLDEHKLRHEIQGLVARGVHHQYLFGTAGEGYAVTESQYVRIVEIFAEEMKAPNLYPMVGLIHSSLQTMLERVAQAYAMGIRDFQFTLPSWGALSDIELFRFFHALCDPYPDCRFMHYNLLRSKRLLTPEEYVRLAEEIPNLVGAKFTTLDLPTIHKLVNDRSPLQFFLGELGYGYGSLLGGECGLLISLASSNMERAWDFFQAGVEQDAAKVLQCQRELAAMLSELLSLAGTPKMDGAYDKLFCRMLDPEFPLRLLPPYETLDSHVFESYRSYLLQELPHWLERKDPHTREGGTR